jgi:cobalt/nickel transport system permease protein
MHISEGVLDAKTVIGGYIVASGLAAVALRKIKNENIPRVSVMGACFFVSSLIHFKIGVSSIHLTLIGLMGIILGPSSILAIISGLFFQAVMFQHGGLSTLGVNAVVFGLPALFTYLVFKSVARKLRQKKILLSLAAGITTGFSILLAAFLVLLILLTSDKGLMGIAVVFSTSHAVLSVIEGGITYLVVWQILRIKPQMLVATPPDQSLSDKEP